MKTLQISATLLLLAIGSAMAAEPAKPPSTERDWAEVDTNRDGLVSPEEMEAYLKANPGPAKPR